jgi:hypothetical protein
MLSTAVNLIEDGSHPPSLVSLPMLASVMRQKGQSQQGCLTTGAE